MNLLPRNIRNCLFRSGVFLLFAFSVSVGQQVEPAVLDGFDLSMLDRKILEAVTKANEKGASTSDKEAAAVAYIQRANFFYNAGRPTLYKLAVGDFRRALRFQPGLAEAQEKLDQIVDIYKSLERSPPANGSDTDTVANDPKFTYRVKPVAVSFENGSTTLSETLAAGIGYWYEFEGVEGRQLSVQMKSGKSPAAFSLYHKRQDQNEPLAEDTAVWNGMLDASGKYLIKVPARNEEYTFTLKLKIK